MLVETWTTGSGCVTRSARRTCFGLTLDIGHCRCLEPAPVPDCVRAPARAWSTCRSTTCGGGCTSTWSSASGEIDFPPVLRALDDTGYRGLVAVELPRHSHAAPERGPRSLAFLTAAETKGTRQMTSADLQTAVTGAVADRWWLARCAVPGRGQPGRGRRGCSPRRGRHCGRGPLPDPRPELAGWTVDDAARVLLLTALPCPGRRWPGDRCLYRYGDAAEKRAVLRALPLAGHRATAGRAAA